MTSDDAVTDDPDNPTRSAEAKRRRTATKTRATVQRRKDEARADKLKDIRRQIGEGRLRVRQMSSSERNAASVAVRLRLAQVKRNSKRAFTSSFKSRGRS
jgi:hypothetical protein